VAEDLKDISTIIAEAVIRAALAYAQYNPGIMRGQHFRDIWVTTSDDPCRFCLAMQSLSQITNVPEGGKFAIPLWVDVPFNAPYDLMYSPRPFAHPNCQCQRVTIEFV
jgi:hypothetical protein